MFYWFIENNYNDPILSSDGFQVRNENKKRLTKSNSELEIFLIVNQPLRSNQVLLSKKANDTKLTRKQ